MTAVITGLAMNGQYKIKTWHHDSNVPGGVFTLQWSSMTAAKTLTEATNGTDPKKLLSFETAVVADPTGKVTLTMTKSDSSTKHVNLNGLSIVGVHTTRAPTASPSMTPTFNPGQKANASSLPTLVPTLTPTYVPSLMPTQAPIQPQAAVLTTYRVDFGTPGENAQSEHEVFTKVGATGTAGPYKISVDGNTQVIGLTRAVKGTYFYLTNMLSSQVQCNAGAMKITIKDLTPLATYRIKSWHHNSNVTAGANFTVQWTSMSASTSLVSSYGMEPASVTTYVASVTADSAGKAVLTITGNAVLNGLDITGLISSDEVRHFPGGDGFIELGAWRIGAFSKSQFSISHQGKPGEAPKTVMVFNSDGTVTTGSTEKFGLWHLGKGVARNVKVGDSFIEFADHWRLGDYNGLYFSLSHKDGQTPMAWRNDGSSWSGPQTAYGLWDKALWMPSRVSQGHRFIEIGALWRIGAVSTEYLSVGSRPTGKTAQVFADDGTIIDGPMLNYTIEKSARKNVPWMSNYYDLATFAPTGAAPSRR